jgi:hypothetical protein
MILDFGGLGFGGLGGEKCTDALKDATHRLPDIIINKNKCKYILYIIISYLCR